MAGDTELAGMEALQVTVPVGASNAVYIADPAFSNSAVIQYLGGGSLIILRAPGQQGYEGAYGSTVSGASLGAAYNAGQYFLVQSPLAYNGAARYYLAATGATVTCQILRSLSSGYVG